MHPCLTNKQRAYLGLRTIQTHWQAEEWLPGKLFYHDGVAIQKIISYYPTADAGPDAFAEADYTIALAPDGLMRPKSGRGKSRAITYSSLEKYAPNGCKFWFDGAGRFQAEAPHYAFILVKGRGGFGNWAKVSVWLDQWITRLPPDLPHYYTSQLAASLPAVQYQPGDVVAFSLSNEAGYGFCCILLDSNRLANAGWIRTPPPDYTGGFHYLNRIITPLLIAEVLQLQKEEQLLDADELAATPRYPLLLRTCLGIRG